MPRTSLVLGGIALVYLAASAEGQSITPLRLGVALGTSFGHNSWAPYGGHAVVSLTSHPVGARFGIRVEALFEGGERFVRRSFEWDLARTSNATVGLTINGIYRVLGQRTGLYAIAGLGVYQTWTEYQPLSGGVAHRSSIAGPGANAGLGFDFKAFGRELFIESRLHSGAFDARVPLTFGIRF